MVASKEGVLLVGRSDQCDLVISHESVSSQHCELITSEEKILLRDLNSTNGTFVNGSRIKEVVLNENDRINVGLVGLIFENGKLQIDTSLREKSSRLSPKILLTTILVIAGFTIFMVLGRQDSKTTNNETTAIPTQTSASSQTPAVQNEETSLDLYSQPTTLEEMIPALRNKVIGASCADGSGSAWPLTVGQETFVVTNHHVVEYCILYERSEVTLDIQGKTTTGEVISYNVEEDLALVSTTSRITGLPTSGRPDIGQWVMVIGNPLGMDRSVTFGTVTNMLEGGIVTDAAINPGNSGGPIFNSAGEVIGIASAKLADEAIDNVGIGIPLAILCDSLLECEPNQWN